MVPVEELFAKSLAYVLGDLQKLVLSHTESCTPDVAFAYFLDRELFYNDGLLLLSKQYDTRELSRGDAPLLAAIGLLMGAGSSDTATAQHWLNGLERLARREPFPADMQAYSQRAVEVFGIAQGILTGCF